MSNPSNLGGSAAGATTSGLGDGHGPPKPTVAEAKAALLAWGDAADAGRAKIISGITSGVMPLVASGAIGAVGALVGNFFAGKRRKTAKPDPAAAGGKADPAPEHKGIFSIGNLIKVAVWLVPLVLKHQAKSGQK